MRVCQFTLLIAPLSGTTIAHYTFGRLIFNDKWTKTWEYVREITPDLGRDDITYLLSPNQDPASTDIVCGRNATVAWNKPKTARIHAGARVGFAPGEPMLPSNNYDTPRIYHQGIASAWLSKSPIENLDDYRGDADWFNIESVLEPTEQSLDWSLPENERWYDSLYSLWGTYMVDSWNFTIPATTPPGEYLLRFEHIYPNELEMFGETIAKGVQWYPNCAHVEIVNDGPAVGKPGPLVKIPGVYVLGQPDIYVNTYAPDFNFSNMKAPEPEVWKG